jgi:pyruvate kinase
MILVGKVESTVAISAIRSIAEVSDVVLLGLGDLLNDAGVDRFYPFVREALTWKRSSPAAQLWIGTQLLEGAAAGVLLRCELLNLGQLVDAGVDGILLSAETTIGTKPEVAIAIAARAFGDTARRTSAREG